MKRAPKFKTVKERIGFYFEDVETFEGSLTDSIIIGLIIISSAVFIALTYDLPPALATTLHWIDIIIVVIFTIEFILRYWVAEDKKKHTFSIYTFIDFVAIVPFYFGLSELGFVRMFRVFRILRLIRFIKKRYLIAHITTEDAFVLVRIVFTLFALVFVSSGLVYFTESQANNEAFDTYFDAFYYSVVTLTTVGFGDITPISTPGRIVTIVMIVSGVIFIPWQISLFLKRLFHTAGKVRARCKSCGLLYHDPDASHCKGCGEIVYIKERDGV